MEAVHYLQLLTLNQAQNHEYSVNFGSLKHQNDVHYEVWEAVTPSGIHRIRKTSICEFSLWVCTLSCAVSKAAQTRSVKVNRKNDVMSLIVTSQRRKAVTRLAFCW